MDFVSISAALGSLTAIKDLTKGMLDLTNEAKIKETVVQLQSIILDAHTNLFQAQKECYELLTKNKELEEIIQQNKEWNKIADQHMLIEVAKSVFVFTRKDNTSGPKYWLCTNCFSKKEVSYLQKRYQSADYYDCPSCKTVIDLAQPTPYHNSDDTDRSWMTM